MGAIRLFLALAVLQSHVTAHFLIPANLSINNGLTLGVNGGYAVFCFFVVSGFLISFVLEDKYDRPGGTAAFYRARALRIYPLWWCLYLIVPFVTGAGLWNFITTRHVYDLLTGFFIYGSDWLLSFRAYPEHYTVPMPHGLELGWTLATEMSFYLIAPFVLRSRAWVLAIFASSILLRMLLNVEFPTETSTTLWISWCYYFFPSLALFFMLGHLSRQLYKKVPLTARGAWLGLGFAALVFLIQDARYSYENVDFYAAILIFAVCLPAIFEATKDNKICNFLGDLTYPLYLSHGVMVAVIEEHVPAVQQAIHYLADTVPGHRLVFVYAKAVIVSVAFWIVALLLATAVHFVIEKPAVRCLRWAFAAYDAARRPSAQDAVVP
jgi:peptidoglycan/LPS O-acetylase OafA/YrhL